MLQSEKQFNTKATTESFEEIYTNYDVSVEEDYLASSGYPFDYPTKWLNDPSMNKRIGIRRLDVLPSTHNFTLSLQAKIFRIQEGTDEPQDVIVQDTKTIDITYQDSLIKVLNHICASFTFDKEDEYCRLKYRFNTKINDLSFGFLFREQYTCEFTINGTDDDLCEFLKFLNQDLTAENIAKLRTPSDLKEFNEVWSRDRLYFHASFSTSKRKFIGKQGDFYPNLTLLYPSPTNESTFYIRFTSNGIKNILIRHCEFDIQLCYIVNYKKSVIL